MTVATDHDPAFSRPIQLNKPGGIQLSIRNGKRQVSSGIIALLVLVLLISACSSKNTPSASNSAAPSTTSNESPINSESPVTSESLDPLGKYDPPIDLSVIRTTEWLSFDEGKSIDDNVWYDAYLRDLGIKVSNMWTVPGNDAYQSKLNVAISSGDIPDLVNVSAIQLKTLVEADMLEDLTEVYEKYASEDFKKIMADDNNRALEASKVDGKIYALPALTPAIGTLKQLWIRQDWLDKLGLPAPETLDDLLKVAQAFTNDDPDGDNKKNTYGLGLYKDITSVWTAPGVDGLFQGFGAYPGVWVKDATGKIVYGSTLPEMKPALQLLNQMYKEGLVDKEFGVQDTAKVYEALNAGKIGMFYGDFASPLYANKDTVVNVPDAVWNAYPLPSIDGTPAKSYVGSSASSFFVIKKGYTNPEAAVKLANYWVDRNFVNIDPTLGTNAETGVAVYPYAVLSFSPPLIHVTTHQDVVSGLNGADTAGFSSDVKTYIENIKAYKADPKNMKDPKVSGGWWADRVFGQGHSGMEVVAEYLDKSLFIGNVLKVPTTPTMSEKMSTLNKMEITMMTRVIMGDAGIEEFDKFVADWNKQGGEQITTEVNDSN